MDLNVGDKVILNMSNSEIGNPRLGIIINENKDNTYHVMYFDDYYINITYSIDYNYIIPLKNVRCERNRIAVVYEKLIEEEKKKLKKVSQEEKDEQKVERYKDIKRRIIRNCERCINKDLDDEDFISRIKEIANLKKQLFSPEKLPIINEIHKYNGTIKYNIRKLEQERNRILNRISDEEIERRFGKFV